MARRKGFACNRNSLDSKGEGLSREKYRQNTHYTFASDRFVLHFAAAGDLGGFAGGATLTNPGTGGFDGAGDGYLHIARSFAAQLGANNAGTEFGGHWLAAGVSRVEMKLNDVDAAQDLEIHFCIGNLFNFWQYDIGFVPPANAWGTFEVDLTDSTRFTHIISTDGGGFAKALQSAERILVRHDRAPYTMAPDNIQGEFGLDDLKLLSSPPVSAESTTWGAIKSLYR